MKNKINAVFDRFDKWRNFSGYQLERRADIFFSFYIVEIVEKYIKDDSIRISNVVIPEYPIKTKETDQSFSIDYALFGENLQNNESIVFFIELKTDMASFNINQQDYLLKAQEDGFEKTIDDIKEKLRKNSSSRQKNFHLLNALKDANVITLTPELRDSTFKKHSHNNGEIVKSDNNYVKHLESITLTEKYKNHRIEIIYISPERPKKLHSDIKCIDFTFFSNYLKDKDDPLSLRFAKSLSTWHEKKAGNDVSVL